MILQDRINDFPGGFHSVFARKERSVAGQRSVIAMVDEQRTQLRAAAEKELKFLSYLSHDLNNNLSSITLALKVHELNLKATGEFVAARKSLLLAQRTIQNTVSGMRRMLQHEQLRTYGKESKISSVDLHAVATEVIGQFFGEAEANGVTLTVAIPSRTIVELDEALLCIVLQNLVGNAVKYSSAGTIRVGCGSDAEAGRLVVWVSDEGPGIAPAEMDHIFEAFQRGQNHGQEGIGLGLTIASTAVKLMGAYLTVESQVGVGSTFTLDLQTHHTHLLPIGMEPDALC